MSSWIYVGYIARQLLLEHARTCLTALDPFFKKKRWTRKLRRRRSHRIQRGKTFRREPVLKTSEDIQLLSYGAYAVVFWYWSLFCLVCTIYSLYIKRTQRYGATRRRIDTPPGEATFQGKLSHARTRQDYWLMCCQTVFASQIHYPINVAAIKSSIILFHLRLFCTRKLFRSILYVTISAICNTSARWNMSILHAYIHLIIRSRSRDLLPPVFGQPHWDTRSQRQSASSNHLVTFKAASHSY